MDRLADEVLRLTRGGRRRRRRRGLAWLYRTPQGLTVAWLTPGLPPPGPLG
jgi:hypothetical protein